IYRSESTTRNVAPNGDGGVGGLSPQVTPRFRIGQGVHARVAIDLYDNNVIEDVRGIVVKIEDYSGIEEYRDQFSLSYHTLQRLDAGQPIYKIRVGWMQKEYFCSEGQLTAVPMSRYTCKQCGKSYSGMVGGGGVCPKCQKDI